MTEQGGLLEWLNVAFLLQHDWKLRKTHELDALLDEAVKYQPDLKDFYNLCEHVSGYYLAVRYPPLGNTSLSTEEVKDNLQKAKKFIRTMFPEEQT